MRSFGLLLLCVGVMAAPGCGANQGGPTTHRASGQVKLDGAPIANANVVFVPSDSAAGLLACQAITDPEGRFEMSTQIGGGKTKRGIAAGSYRVEVTKLEPVTTMSSAPKNLLPDQYASSDSSGLTAEIVAGGQNQLLFELKK